MQVITKTQVQPYLFFEGRCEEALEFYKQAAGAEVTALMRFQDSPEPCEQGGMKVDPSKVMHASFRIGETEILASDGMCQAPAAFQGFSLALSVPDEAQADRLFAGLAEGGQVVMPLGKTFFSPKFGMVTDRFGVGWMILVSREP